MSTQLHGEPVIHKGFWARMRERVFGPDDSEPSSESPVTDSRERKVAALRLETSRATRVAIRLNATAFEHAQIAADGLKAGQQQIINIERAEPRMAERIIDFLS